MKRLSVLLIIVLVAGLISGCRYAIIEEDSVMVSGWAARAEGASLFKIDDINTDFYKNAPPADLTRDPTPEPGETLEPVSNAVKTPTPKPEVTAAPTSEPVETHTPEPQQTEAIVTEEEINAADVPDEAEPDATRTPIGLHSRDEEGETAVRKLQARLKELGYLDQEPDGDFGSKTLKALKRFQKDSDLKQTGVLDEDTEAKLYPQPAVTTAPEDVMYTEGAYGADIRLVQQRLRQYGFYTRSVSGVYDEYTADQVQAFQEYAVEYYGTEYDDPMPLLVEAALLENDAEVASEPVEQTVINSIPEMPALEPEATLRPEHALDGVVSENLYQYLKDDRFPVYRQTLQRGDYGAEVERVQRRLTTLDYYYEDIIGEYDDATSQAVKSFQHRSELQETGIADEETQRKLFSEDALEGERVDQPFYIKVSISDQRVYVYRWSDGGYNQLIKTMICSTGFGNSTPRGVFVSPGQRDARWHYFAEFHCWAQYAFIIKGNILFHSVIYSRKDENSLRRSTLAHLGHKASHGCVRLKVEDAKWIYEHCGEGQVIEIY